MNKGTMHPSPSPLLTRWSGRQVCRSVEAVHRTVGPLYLVRLIPASPPKLGDDVPTPSHVVWRLIGTSHGCSPIATEQPVAGPADMCVGQQ